MTGSRPQEPKAESKVASKPIPHLDLAKQKRATLSRSSTSSTSNISGSVVVPDTSLWQSYVSPIAAISQREGLTELPSLLGAT